MSDLSSVNFTINDVAQAAGVSIATVSRVLHARPDVSEKTRQRVQQVIEQLGYQGGAARTQRYKEADQYIRLITPGVNNEYLGLLISGILDQVDIAGAQLILHSTGMRVEREVEYIEAAKSNGSNGLLIILPCSSDQDLLRLVNDRIPCVVVDTRPDTPALPSICVTNWQGGRDATQYLLRLGHRRIGFIAGRQSSYAAIAREHGYRSALMDAGVAFDEQLLRQGDYHRPSGYQAAQELLALPNRPTAIFACSDVMAMGVIEAIYTAGLRVPDDISVIGFDDIPTASTLYPPLTTVRQPLYEMGRMAAQMVMEMANGREPVARQVELPTQLIVRDSCRAIAEARK